MPTGWQNNKKQKCKTMMFVHRGPKNGPNAAAKQIQHRRKQFPADRRGWSQLDTGVWHWGNKPVMEGEEGKKNPNCAQLCIKITTHKANKYKHTDNQRWNINSTSTIKTEQLLNPTVRHCGHHRNTGMVGFSLHFHSAPKITHSLLCFSPLIASFIERSDEVMPLTTGDWQD